MSEATLLDEPSASHHNYAVQPVRPTTQLAARAGLWIAVALGCLGGCVGILRPSGGPAPIVGGGDDATSIPSPVAGVAELAVEAWLTVDSEDLSRVSRLFVTPPGVDGVDTAGLTVSNVTAVAGRRIQPGYWSITVAVDVTEEVVAPAEQATEDAQATTTTSTWYVEIGIVGDTRTGLAALATPAVVPRPPEVSDRWRLERIGGRTPELDDPLVQTVEGFLSALLVGQGDPARYATTDLEMAAIEPAPFTNVVVLQIAVFDLDSGGARVWTQIRARTPGDSHEVLAYELVLRQRQDRWEITRFSGVPTIRPDPEQPTTTSPTTSTSPEQDEAPVATGGTRPAADPESPQPGA